MLEKILTKISYDIAIDLGTSSILVYVRNKGIIANEPSVITIHKKTKQVLAVGSEAKKMIGKTPQNLEAIRPLRNGVISDFYATEQLLSHFVTLINNLPSKFPKYPRPKVVIGVPSGLTSVERKAVVDSALNAGARKALLVEEPMAAAIGAGLPVKQASGSMIVDSGGGTTEIAVISLGGTVLNRSIKIAGDQLDQDIVNYARQKYNLLLGEKTAEELKCQFGTATEILSNKGNVPDKFVLQGRDLKTGLPRSITAPSSELRDAMKTSLHQIVNAIKDVLESIPAELMPDILKSGLTLAGGTSLLTGLPKFISTEINAPVYVATDPVTCVVRGCGYLLEDEKLLELVRIK
ncbi:MAG TPA: rod shape-determining protein [candidate division WWE3 bacterium]|uniref:Cell shape-determining protein MreB n=1 Tax=candidate division WWE3 bacterium TaxID=2053526 RepID=A0A7C1DGH2_UNCKA|nr:rod shape-determining protein [candidate division WWE3 bacterium]